MKVKIGDKLKIISMFCQAEYNSKTGTVTEIKEGLIYGTWGKCAIIPNIDCFEFID